MTINVESCKKINGGVQTFRFSVFAMVRQELCAENAQKTPKLEKLKRNLLNVFIFLVHKTRNWMRVAIESGKGMKVKVLKLC